MSGKMTVYSVTIAIKKSKKGTYIDKIVLILSPRATNFDWGFSDLLEELVCKAAVTLDHIPYPKTSYDATSRMIQKSDQV